MSALHVLRRCELAAMTAGSGAYGLIPGGALVHDGSRILWTGPDSSLPAEYRQADATDLEGRLVTPALIDCHTHVVFGGNRAREFEMRLGGATYEEIAKAGGGILSTVGATRQADDETLFRTALDRVDAMMASGTGTLEIKSGYGLSTQDELRMLRIARRIGEERPVRVTTTWLAAHAVPPDYEGRRDAYLEEVVIEGLRQAHREGLVDAVDAFSEGIAFSREEVTAVFDEAGRLGLPVKLHAEQLSDQKGAVLASSRGALSADHLEYLDPDDASAMARSGTVAVLLPGAFLTLKEQRPPPVSALREASVPLAVATDCNPGSSPMTSLPLAMNLACTLFGLTPEEALLGTTRHAAKALGLTGGAGTLARGAPASIAIWDAGHPAELSYWLGKPLLHRLHLPDTRQ